MLGPKEQSNTINYEGVHTRFLHDNERLLLSQEKEMPLVIEAKERKDAAFLQHFLTRNSTQLIQDMAHYGAVLLRGFDIDSDQQFEKTILSIPEFQGISEAFMAENGRTHVDDLRFVLHTNSVYKTGGTLYLGGFHTENYYSPDVPAYIFFYCAQPSSLGGETGIINTQKIYQHLNPALREKLEKNSFFVSRWLISEIAKRYNLDVARIEQLAEEFNLPIEGTGDERFILMYKPSVLLHPLTQEKALQINLFELPTLNKHLRACFKADYPGKEWFWHRFFWSLPDALFHTIEFLAVICIAFFHSPKNSYRILRNKLASYLAQRKTKSQTPERVGSCFSPEDVNQLAKSMRQHYSSCLWKRGDILLIDNRKVMHAGMPGKGHRVIRAMIANPIQMNYGPQQSGINTAKPQLRGSIGSAYQKEE